MRCELPAVCPPAAAARVFSLKSAEISSVSVLWGCDWMICFIQSTFPFDGHSISQQNDPTHFKALFMSLVAQRAAQIVWKLSSCFCHTIFQVMSFVVISDRFNRDRSDTVCNVHRHGLWAGGGQTVSHNNVFSFHGLHQSAMCLSVFDIVGILRSSVHHGSTYADK